MGKNDDDDDDGGGLCIYICRRQQSKDSSSRLLNDSVSSTSSRDSPDDVINRCPAVTSDVVPKLHNSQTDDVTMTSCLNSVPTFHSDTVPPTILLTDGTVPTTLDYRSVLVGAALAQQQMMTSLNRYSHHSDYQYHHRHGRRFTPYVVTDDFTASSFRPT